MPGAETRWQGRRVTVLEAAPVFSGTWEKPSHVPGEILDVGDNGWTVQAGLGCVQVKKVQTKEHGKVSALDFATTSGLKVGDVLESLLS